MRNELVRLYHHRTRNCVPPKKYVETYSRSRPAHGKKPAERCRRVLHPRRVYAGAYVDGGAGDCATALQDSSWHQQSCCSPVPQAALRAFPFLTSTSNLRAHDGRRLMGVSHTRRGQCPSLA